MEHAVWLREAACRDEDPELFFPLGYEGPVNQAQVKQAKIVCSNCPVLSRCLSRALYIGERDGIFGGTTPDERRTMHRPVRRLIQKPQKEQLEAEEQQLASLA